MTWRSGGAGGLFRRAAVDTRPLRDHDYRRLWLGQGVSAIGFQLTSVAVPLQTYALTHSSFWVGMLGFANLVPLVIFGLWGGAVADAMDRRRLLLIASMITWISTVALLAQTLFGVHSVGVLMAIVVVQSIGFAISSPTRGAIIPRLLPVELVPAANTLNFTVQQLATVIGPLIAGGLLGAIGGYTGYAVAYGIDAALFTVGLYAAVRLPRLPPLSGMVGRPGLKAVIEGLAFLGTRPVLLMSFVVDIIAMVFAMPRALYPEVSETEFGGPGAAGWLFASISIGSVIAGLFSGWIGRVHRQGLALVVAIVAWGVAVAFAGFAHSLWMAVLLMAVAGAADLISAVYRQTILQTYAPDEMRGRLQGVFIVVVAGGPRLGDLRAGVMATAVGATASWVGGGVLCVVLVVIVAALVPSFLRYDTRRDLPPRDGSQQS
ncbi:MAG: MFS transporter [Streptosporangiales bacterium]|nr:MFS transporter [Streptosporangiales bacterium]